MRKNNWIVAAIAAVACGVLLWAWFALGFNHVDDPLDLVVAIVWWLAVAAVVGGIVWAEGKRREKMRLAFVGEGAGCSPEAGLVMPDAGESELAALERTLSGMAFPDEVAALDEKAPPCPAQASDLFLVAAVLGTLPGGLRLRRGRRGERSGTFPRHFCGCDRVGWILHR